MIGFLQPLALLGLLAASIPPLLHLLNRRLPPVVPFPAVRYLTETERKHSRHLKLRNLLLLILRTLLIVLIALAAARPVARVPVGGAHEPAALGIVLDNSLSSGAVVNGTRVLDKLIEQARHVLDRAGDDDRVWLVLADGLPRRVSLPEARQIIDTLSPWPVRLDLSAAVRATSQTMAGEPVAGHEVVVLSDLQASALSGGLAPADSETTAGRRVLAYAPPGLDLNRGIDSVRVDPPVWSPGGDVVAVIGGTDESPITVQLTLNGRDVARSFGGLNDRVVLSSSSTRSGWFVASVRLDPDELRADDERRLAVRVAPRAAAVAAAGAGSFVTEALAVLGESGRVGDGARVTFSDGLAVGVSIVFPPSDPALVGALNRTLDARGITWRFGDVVEGEWQIAGLVGPAVGSPVWRRRRLEGSGTVIARLGDGREGEPWLVRDGDVILVGSRMETDWTSLPVSAGFVPFLDLLMNRIAAAQSWIVSALPGEVVEIPEAASALLTPDGAIPIPASGRITAPVSPGVYFLRGAGTDTVGAVEVNHDPRESMLRRVIPRVLRSTLGGDVRVLSDRGLDRELFSGARRAELAGGIIILAIIVALAEFVVSSAGGLASREH